VDLGSKADAAGDANNLEPLSETEYHEMLSVLTKDAAEADDVVLEIQDRIGEMETTFDQVLEQRDALTSASTATTAVFHSLAKFASTKLPTYVAQCHTFAAIRKEEHERIQAGMVELTELRSLYIGFLDAYDGLILEAARRKSVRMAVEKVLRDARTKLDKFYADDVHAREKFRLEQGDYLPSDIWPDLGKGPMRVEFTRVFDGEEEEHAQQQQQQGEAEGETVAAPVRPARLRPVDIGVDSVPDLPRQVVERALERVKMRGKAGKAGKARDPR
jgi:autophagy-related protein 17